MNRPEQSNNTLQRWLKTRRSSWQRTADAIDRLRGRGAKTTADIDRVVSEYRSVARDLAVARQALPGTALTRALESSYQHAHDLIHRPSTRFWSELKQLYTQRLPEVCSRLQPQLIAVSLLFVLTALAGWTLIASHPELASLFASHEMIDGMQRGELWTDDLFSVTPPAILSASIIQNNVMVSLFAFCLGVFFGLGTLYIIGINGLMLGGIFAAAHDHQLAVRLFEFVVAHGLVEISVILIAGAAGIWLGEALARPGKQTRSAALKNAVNDAGVLMALVVPLLLGCGLIEGYLSPDPNFPMASRVVVGVGYWVIMVILMSGRLWSKRPPVGKH